jgi:hypothetical protein
MARFRGAIQRRGHEKEHNVRTGPDSLINAMWCQCYGSMEIRYDLHSSERHCTHVYHPIGIYSARRVPVPWASLSILIHRRRHDMSLGIWREFIEQKISLHAPAFDKFLPSSSSALTLFGRPKSSRYVVGSPTSSLEKRVHLPLILI